MSQKYKLRAKRFDHEAGTVVWRSHKCDYGLCSDDYRATGLEHILVTPDPDKDYGFTIPRKDLEEI